MCEQIQNIPSADVIELEPYPTLHRQKKAKLVAVHEMRIRDDCFDLLRTTVPSRNHRQLNRERVIQLVFIGDRDIPFFTLLSYEGWLKEYYSARIGWVFQIQRICESK